MAFDIKRALQRFFNQFARSFEDIFYGYEMNGYDVENKSGKVTARFTCKPKGTNNDVVLTTFITATNIGQVFNDITSDIDKLSEVTIKKNKSARDTITLLTGAKLSPGVDDGDYVYQVDPFGTKENPAGTIYNDISIQTAEKNKTGLLGVDLQNCSEDEAGEWYNLAFDDLKYELICETNGTHDAGKIDGLNPTECIEWIYKYIEHIGNVPDNKQLSHEEKTKQQEEINLKNAEGRKLDSEAGTADAFNLVRPILIDIQEQLKKKYQNKLNSELSLDKLIPQEKADDSQNQDEGEAESDETTSDEAEGGSDMTENSNASTHINVTLRKIQATDDIDVLLLEANCPPADTLNYVDDIINQDEFFNTLTEEPQSYSIDVTDEGYDIEQCDEQLECDSCKILEEVFFAAIQAYRNLQIVHWMSSGPDMMKIHTMSEEMYDELSEEIDTLGELLVEKCGTIPQLDFPCEYIDIKKYDLQSGLDAIKIVISPYIDVIDYAYPNQTSDVQSTLDEWLRYWNKQLNYFVKNQEV